jgi:hypothetical protein
MLKYLRYLGTHVLIALTIAGLLLGQGWAWLGIGSGVVGWIGADALSGAARTAPRFRHPAVLDYALYSFLPAVAVLCVVYAWVLSPHDLLGLGAALQQALGIDVLARRAGNDWVSWLGASLSVALAMALGAILTAHELVHRTQQPVAMFVGRWLLAMAWNASLEVAHVYGHHRDVGTPADPATARRGENVYAFFVRSTLGQVRQAWTIERQRLRGATRWQALVARNKVSRGFVRSTAVALAFLWAAGAPGLALFLVASMWNKLLLEALNYLEHYGLVRDGSTPYALRHAWDTNRAFSHVVLIHLPMHSEHHLEPRAHFEALEQRPESPLLPCGYLAALLLTLIPPLWQRLMAPKLAEWDRHYASPRERSLLAAGE